MSHIDTERADLVSIIQHTNHVRTELSVMISAIVPSMGASVEIEYETQPDFDSMTNAELISYIERGAKAMREFVDNLLTEMGPKLNSPMVKLALKSMASMVA